MTALRLTWVQPEDLLGHELRQAEEDGRDTTEIRTRWQTAGGPGTPPRAGLPRPRPRRTCAPWRSSSWPNSPGCPPR